MKDMVRYVYALIAHPENACQILCSIHLTMILLTCLPHRTRDDSTRLCRLSAFITSIYSWQMILIKSKCFCKMYICTLMLWDLAMVQIFAQPNVRWRERVSFRLKMRLLLSFYVSKRSVCRASHII